MKKFIFGVIVATSIIGIAYYFSYDELEYTNDDYQRMIANRDTKIEQLEDSVSKLNSRVELYDQLVDWFRTADSAQLDKAVHELWNIRNE